MGRFEDYCRVPGTRCNTIMTLIERGATNAEIAARFSGPWADVDETVIEVYRKALEGRLSKGSANPEGAGGKPTEAERLAVAMLKASGATQKEIAERLGITEGRVKGILYNGRHKDRPSGPSGKKKR